MRRRLLLSLLLPGLLAGCSPSGPDLSQVHDGRGGTLRLVSQNDIRTLDTAIGYDSPSWRFERLINDGLLNYGEDATLVPAIATALPTIEQGRRFTFHLRDDVWFHHGRKVEAGDVKYAIERVLDPHTKSPAASLFGVIAGAKAFSKGQAKTVTGLQCPDEQTLVIELAEPDVSFLNVLAMPFADPIPRELVEANDGRGWSERVVGCGPYRLDQWVRGMRIRVRRFDRYYRPDLGFVERVEQRFGVPEFMQLMMFERGEADVSDIPLPDFDRVTHDPRLKQCLLSTPDSATYYCSMNTELPPFDNRQVRQAFNYAVDKDRVARILNGTVTPAKGVLPPVMPGYNPRLAGYPHDPERARRMLAEAGYPRGLSVELTTRSRPKEKAWAEAVQQDLREVGVDCTINPVAFPQWLDLSSKRRALPFSVNAWFQDYPDPSNFLDILLSGERITAVNCNNRAFYHNPVVDRWLAQARGMTNRAARLAVYQRIEELVVDDAPWIFLFHPSRYVLVQPWVHGYTLHPVWSSRDERVWLGPPTVKGSAP